MQKNIFQRDVIHPLTEEEVIVAYDRAHDLEERADRLEEELKEGSKDRKSEIRRLRLDAKHRREAAAARSELRSVACYEELRGSQVVTLRADTLAVVDQRAATAADQQETFPGLDTGVAEEDLDLPLPADYTPTESAPKVATEKKPRKPRKARAAKSAPHIALVPAS